MVLAFVICASIDYLAILRVDSFLIETRLVAAFIISSTVPLPVCIKCPAVSCVKMVNYKIREIMQNGTGKR